MIEIHNVHKRENNLLSPLNESSSRINLKAYQSNLEKRYNFDSIKTIIEHSSELDPNPLVAFNMCLDYMEEVCLNDKSSRIKEIINVVSENAMNKVKDAKQIQNSINKKKGSITHRLFGKINSVIAKGKAAVGMGGTKNTNKVAPDTVHKKQFEQRQKQEDKQNKDFEEQKKKKLNEAYDTLLEMSNNYKFYDRIIGSRKKINERYDLSKTFKKNGNNLRDFCESYCMFVDTFEAPFRAKYNICLENILYEYERNDTRVNKDKLAKYVTEYFLRNRSFSTKDELIREASTDNKTKKLIETASRLSKNKDPEVADIGNKTLSILSSAIDGSGAVVNRVREVVAGIIILLGTATFVAAIGVGVITLLSTLAIGLVALLTAIGIGVIIAPKDIKMSEGLKALKKCIASEKDSKKKKQLEKVYKLLSGKDSNKLDKINETYISLDFDSNKYDMESVLNSNRFYNTEDIKEAVSLLNEKEYKDIRKLTLTELASGTNLNDYIHESASSKAKECMKKFMNTPVKSKEAFNTALKVLFTDSPENVIEECPNFLRVLFMVFVIGGACSISIALGLLAAMTHYFISMHVERKYAAEYLKKYKKHRETVKKKLDNAKDENTKEKTQKYLEELDKQISKLEVYEEGLHTEKELDERREKESSSGLDDDEELKIESAIKAYNDLFINIQENYIKNTEILSDMITSDNLEHRLITSAIKEAAKYYLANTNQLEKVTEEAIDECEKEDFRRRNTLLEVKKLLENTIPYKGKRMFDKYNRNINKLHESLLEYDSLKSNKFVLNEMDFTNNLKMIVDGLHRDANKLDEKQQQTSKSLDGFIDNIRYSMENALKQENKEAVIRGSILPPVSRMIKLALATGLLWIISPVIAVIGIVAVFAMSKDLRSKERQIVLDELNTELEITDKYIEKYKSENDMQKLRQCLQIQKKLLRERDRLKYRTKVDYDEKVPDNPEIRNTEHLH